MTEVEQLTLNLMLVEKKIDEVESQIQMLSIKMNNTNIEVNHLKQMNTLCTNALSLRVKHESMAKKLDILRDQEY